MSLRPFFVLVLALAGCLGEVSDGSGIDEISGEIVSSAPSFTGSIAPAPQNNPYGFNDDWGIRPEASMNLRAYDTARRANFGFVRYTVYMWQMQDAAGNISAANWQRLEDTIRQAQYAGLQVYLTLSFFSAYMTPGYPDAYRPFHCIVSAEDETIRTWLPECTDAAGRIDRGRFVDFVRQIVTRFGDRVKYWGFGNEMASKVFWRGGDALTEVFQPAYDTAHAVARERGYDIKVVGSDNFYAFGAIENDLQRERAMGRKLWDVIAFHNYLPGWNTYEEALNVIQPYRALGGDYREVWMTESGFQYDAAVPSSVWGQNAQLATLYDLVNQWRTQGRLDKFFLYRLQRDAVRDHGVIDFAGNPIQPTWDSIRARTCPSGRCADPAIIHGLGSVDGDRFADFVDSHVSSGNSWAHLMVPNNPAAPTAGSFGGGPFFVVDGTKEYRVSNFSGTAQAELWQYDPRTGSLQILNLEGTTVAYPRAFFTLPRYVQLLVGDFNADGMSDVGYRDPGTGDVFVAAMQVDSWSPMASLSPFALVGRTARGADWQVLFGDFTGDARMDYADHHRPSGQFWIHRNDGTRLEPHGAHAWMGTTVAPAGEWGTLIGDFTGDGFTDYADFHRTSGQFWVHENMRSGSFAAYGVDWAYGDTAPDDGGWRILGR
jgi:hypothetical protein